VKVTEGMLKGVESRRIKMGQMRSGMGLECDVEGDHFRDISLRPKLRIVFLWLGKEY